MKTRLRSLLLAWMAVWAPAAVCAQSAGSDGGEEIPVTIKELDVEDTIREFKRFQEQLEKYRAQVSEGQKIAAETAAALDELRRTAAPENGYNESAILDAIRNYVDGVVGRQSELVDFLQSQRYRISYYANKLVAAVRPEDIALLFGTEEGNLRDLQRRTRRLDEASREIAAFIDGLSPDEFDRRSFQPLSALSEEKRRRLARLQLRYQNAKNALEVSRSRLRLVREAQRASKTDASKLDLNVDLLMSQMFGTLDRIRLQMSMDLLYLETFLARYEQTARTQEILQALQQLVALQGGLEGPSPGLANVLTWLEDSSARKLALGVEGFQAESGAAFPRSSDLLKEAYAKGRGQRAGKRKDEE